MNTKPIHPANEPYSHVPAITTIAMPLSLFGRPKKKQSTDQPPQEKPKHKPKPKGLATAKYEVAEGKVKFYVTRGLFKKRWVVLKEFPIYEISAVEYEANWLSLTWNGAAYPFVLKKKDESFAKLQEQIQGMLEEHQKALQANEKAALRKSELLSVINASLPVVDSAFDILMGLHEKRVNWTLQETLVSPLAAPLNFKAQTLPPLDLDFSKITAAVKAQVAKETSKETLNLLRAIHAYFTDLKTEDDLADTAPNFEHAKSLMLAYFTLNDLLLAKTIGEKDSTKEIAYLEETLKALAEGTNFKVAVEPLVVSLDQLGVESEGVNAVNEARALFKGQLKQF